MKGAFHLFLTVLEHEQYKGTCLLAKPFSFSLKCLVEAVIVAGKYVLFFFSLILFLGSFVVGNNICVFCSNIIYRN